MTAALLVWMMLAAVVAGACSLLDTAIQDVDDWRAQRARESRRARSKDRARARADGQLWLNRARGR